MINQRQLEKLVASTMLNRAAFHLHKDYDPDAAKAVTTLLELRNKLLLEATEGTWVVQSGMPNEPFFETTLERTTGEHPCID